MKDLQARDAHGLGHGVAILAALVASLALIWFTTDSLSVTLAFAGGLLVLGLIALAAARLQRAPDLPAEIEPDWSVTLAAIEQPGIATAITDRANRLVCANGAYREWFGPANAPPRLQTTDVSTDRLTRIARAAWRDGAWDGAPGDTIAIGQRSFTIAARRAGSSEDYLVWRLTPTRTEDAEDALGEQLAGPLGDALDEAGVAAALVGPRGNIRAFNAAFARGASDDDGQDLTGREMLALLRTDEDEGVRFERDDIGGTAHLLLEAPLSGPAAPTHASDPEPVPRLVLLIERERVIGAAPAGDGTGAGNPAPHLEALIDRLPLGLAAVSRDGRFLFANSAFCRAASIGEKGLPSFPSDLVARVDKTSVADTVRRYSRGVATGGDITVRLAANPDETVSLGLTGVRGLGETAVLLSLADTSEENRLKRQVAQATKMQAVGQLAGGVAHDFNNVLTAIIGTCDLMLLRHAPGDSDYDDIQQIKANSNRAASLTRQLLAFSRQQTLKPEVIQLPDVLSEVTQLLRRLLGARITLDVHHDRDLGAVRADPRQLEQVIVNLAVNARDAIQEKGGGEHTPGTLSFATRHISADDIRELDSDIMPPGEYTALIVEDTGGGIPRRVLAKIFEPFFTTKDAGKGTGLGLSTVYGIIKQSGGFIFAENVRKADGTIGGARFTIYLPVYALAPGERQAPPPPPPDEQKSAQSARDWAAGGRVLLVEDEDMVRVVAERALTRAGYTVTIARDGEEGLEAFAKTKEPAKGDEAEGGFDIVVSDVVMPGIDGPAMARALREQEPALPVLFMSGYAEAQLRAEIDIEGVQFIAKPFSVQQIVDKVGDVLKARAPAA